MILLVGASVRALMESGIESGHEVMGIDFYGDADARWQGKTMSLTADYGLEPSVKYLLEVARAISCHGLVYASGPENAPEELAYWEGQNLLRGNGPSVLTAVRNPWILSQSLGQISMQMPQFYSIGQWQQLKDAKSWLLKPLNRGGGHGIVELPKQQEESLALISSLAQPTQFIVEEKIEGIPGSVTFLANGREAIAVGTSRQLIGGGKTRPFLYEGNIVPLEIQGIIELKSFERKITEVIVHLAKDFGLKGINTLDFIVNEDGIWILELNPRWSASVELIERFCGKRLFSSHLAACKGVDLTPIFAAPFYDQRRASRDGPVFWGKRIVYANDSFVVASHDEKQLRVIYEQGVRDIPSAGTIIAKGQPLCTVLSEGDSDRECTLNLGVMAEWIQQFFKQTKMARALKLPKRV